MIDPKEQQEYEDMLKHIEDKGHAEGLRGRKLKRYVDRMLYKEDKKAMNEFYRSLVNE